LVVAVVEIPGHRSTLPADPGAAADVVAVDPRMLQLLLVMVFLAVVFLAGAAAAVTTSHRSPAEKQRRQKQRKTNPPLGLQIQIPEPFQHPLLPHRYCRSALADQVPPL
jgi:flagellar basal body-associated protein FliL